MYRNSSLHRMIGGSVKQKVTSVERQNLNSFIGTLTLSPPIKKENSLWKQCESRREENKTECNMTGWTTLL